MKRPSLSLLAAALVSAATLTAAQAGPPLLCFPYQIGQAKSLPWGNDAFESSKGYDKSRVVEDTLELLKTERSVLVRMETLRRAAIYIGQDARKASDLLARLSWMAMDSEAIGKPSAVNWFDAGFFAATIRQNGADIGWHAGCDDKADGFLYVKKALQIDKDDPAMLFGAALVAFEHDQKAHKDYLRRAIAGVKPGSDLAASIESNWACGHKPIEELRKELGDARADAKSGK